MKVEPLENRRLLSVTPALVEVPISAAAIAADPELNNYRTFDLRVTITADDDWASGDMYVALSSGHFYIPGDNLNADYAQKSLWKTYPNLEFDTFVCTPNYGVPFILGGSYLNGLHTSQFADKTLDAAWGDLASTPAGTYTVARLTISSDVNGIVLGRVGSIGAPPRPEYYGSALPVLPVQGMISGGVYWDRDADGAPTEGDTPLAATLFLDSNDNGQLDPGETTTSTIGKVDEYAFTNLAPGTYHVRQFPPDGYAVSSPANGEHTITLADSQRLNAVDFGNVVAGVGQLRVVTFNDSNQNGIFDEDDAGVLGDVTVFLDSNRNGILDAGEPSATSDGTGVALIANVPFGDYSLREVVQDWMPSVPVETFDHVIVGQAPTTVNFGCVHVPPGSIHGYVFNDMNDDGVRQANERPISGITVYLHIDDGTVAGIEIPTITGVDGWYRFTNVAGGAYTLHESLPAGYVLARYLSLEQTIFVHNATEELCVWGNRRDIRRVFSTAPVDSMDWKPDFETMDTALIESLL